MSELPLDAAGFAATLDVSRETMARLKAYEALLRRWQPAINLVAAATLGDVWRRHFLDSAQLLRYLPEASGPLADLGSGAGFPGLVLAILGAPEVELLESDARKCAFLREAIRVTGSNAKVREGRIEAAPRHTYAVVIARALAPLETLLGHAAALLRPGGVALFLKGRRLEEELTAARKAWKMDLACSPSISEPGGRVLRLKEITRVGSNG